MRSQLSTTAKVYLAIVFVILYAPIFYLIFIHSITAVQWVHLKVLH